MADIPLNEEILRLFLPMIVSAALFTMYAEYAVGRAADAVRLTAGVVSHVGFLGVILGEGKQWAFQGNSA